MATSRPPRFDPSLTPTMFESYVAGYLRYVAGFTRQTCEVVEQGRVRGAGGEYAVDILVRFGALGFDFLLVVECKHHRAPVKRKDVQALLAMMQDARAQKGALFSTSGFQRGAIEFAAEYSIALVHCKPNTEPRIAVGGYSDFGAEGHEPLPRLSRPIEWDFYWGGARLSAEHWRSMETLALPFR
jgi:hypothetical protein